MRLKVGRRRFRTTKGGVEVDVFQEPVEALDVFRASTLLTT
jgi:hypothetical protein